MVGAEKTGSINKLHESPTFITLWHLQRQLVDSLREVENVNFPLDGHTGYILPKEAFVLFLSK